MLAHQRGHERRDLEQQASAEQLVGEQQGEAFACSANDPANRCSTLMMVLARTGSPET